MLIRADGPVLATFQLSNALSDPVLEVRDASGTLVAENDNWNTPETASAGHPAAGGSDILAAETATGAFPLPAGSADAAVVVTLDPGMYTTVITGSNGSSGAVLVEIYEITP